MTCNACCRTPFGICGNKHCRCHPPAEHPISDTPQERLIHVDQLNNNRNPHIE